MRGDVGLGRWIRSVMGGGGMLVLVVLLVLLFLVLLVPVPLPVPAFVVGWRVKAGCVRMFQTGEGREEEEAERGFHASTSRVVSGVVAMTTGLVPVFAAAAVARRADHGRVVLLAATATLR